MEKIIEQFKKLSPRVEEVGDGEYSVRYYMDGELMGIVRCKLVESMGINKPIKQRYVMIISGETEKLIGYILSEVTDLNEDLYNEISSSVGEMIYNNVREIILG